MFDDDKKVAENDVCIFYANSMTMGAMKWAKEWGLDDIQCLLAVQKKNEDDKDYVLIRDDQFIYATKRYEDLACHIDAIAISEGKKRI